MAVEYPIQPATRGVGDDRTGFVKGPSLGVRRNVSIYVDAAAGNDSADGLTPATAVQTVEAAHHRIPTCSIGPATNVVINLAGIGGFGAAATAQQTYAAESVLLPSSGHAELNRFHYRGPAMTLATLATGPNSGAISALTHLWWPPDGSARARTASVGSPGTNYILGGVRVTRSGGANWTVGDERARFVRILRGSQKVIFECPIAQLAATSFVLDLSRMPDGTMPGAALLVGDTWEIVECGARLINPSGTRINIEGQGGGQGVPGDYVGVSTRGGGGFTFERINFGSTFMAGGCVGLSFDRCDFGNVDGTSTGDLNMVGGSGAFVNCLFTTIGVLLHMGWTQLHDSANCRPDIASDDPAAADPIYQTVDAFSMWGVCRNRCRLFVGSGTSSSPAYLTLERNFSCYGALAAGIWVGFHSVFRMLDQRDRQTQIQGTGNAMGIDLQGGSLGQYTLLGGLNGVCPMAHLLGDGADGLGLNDCRLGGGTTHTWDEVYAGGTLPSPSQANNWIDTTFNFSRLTAYDG